VKTFIREIEVRVKRPTHWDWVAIVRNGVVIRMDKIGKTCKTIEGINEYMVFCREVKESISSTGKEEL